MARRDKRRTRERRRERRAALRLCQSPKPRRRRARLTHDSARRLLARERETAAGILLGRFCADDPVLELVRPLVLTILPLAPKLLEHPGLHMPLVMLAVRRPRWIRPLSQWRPVGRGRGRQFRSLLDHLLVRYPVRRFLYEVFRGSPTPSAEVDLFVHLAGGGSMRAAVDTGLVPSTLTRAMCHHFLRAPAEATVVQAVRLAQVAGHGGAPWIAHELNRTSVGRTFDDEAFWSAAIAWLCRHAPIARGEVAHVVDYLRDRRRSDPRFVPEACRLQGLGRQLERWQRALSTTAVPDETLPASGIAGYAFEIPTPGNASAREQWEVSELRNAHALVSEGRHMRHCVASYVREVRHGGTSIWSLRREGRRRVTIEVCNRTRRIVQAKGRRNRDPSDRELALVRAWAHRSGLRLGEHVRAR